MTCYLKLSCEETTCEGCGRKMPPCLIGVTDSFKDRELTPICDQCLRGLEPHLANIQQGVWNIGAVAWRLMGHLRRGKHGT